MLKGSFWSYSKGLHPKYKKPAGYPCHTLTARGHQVLPTPLAPLPISWNVRHYSTLSALTGIISENQLCNSVHKWLFPLDPSTNRTPLCTFFDVKFAFFYDFFYFAWGASSAANSHCRHISTCVSVPSTISAHVACTMPCTWCSA